MLKKYGIPAVIVMMLVVLFGYSIGKSMAKRDNAQSAAAEAAAPG